MNKKKLQQAIESQTKAKNKITWRRQVSDPLSKGNGSTHPRQNHAQTKSTNHQTKARKTTKSCPYTHASSPWTNATPLDECMQNTTWNRAAATTQPWPARLVNTTGQTGVQHVNRTSTLTGQTGDLDRSDQCTPEPRNGSKPPENLLNASSKPFQAQTSPPCWQCMNQAKNAKLST
jgi:hypothetical protein